MAKKKEKVYWEGSKQRIKNPPGYLEDKVYSIVEHSPYYKKHGKYPGLTQKMIDDHKKRQGKKK